MMAENKIPSADKPAITEQTIVVILFLIDRVPCILMYAESLSDELSASEISFCSDNNKQ